MIKTTVYSDGVISTGYYYDSRGDGTAKGRTFGIKTTVDYAGNEEDYSDMMLELRLHNDDITEIRHVVNHRINARSMHNTPTDYKPLQPTITKGDTLLLLRFIPRLER